MAGRVEFEYPYEASDEASESELLERSLSVWSGLACFGGDDFAPVPLDLHTASSIGHYECIRNIIEKREEDLNRKNQGGWTALMYASYIGYDTVVNLLLEAGVDVNTRNNKGLTSLMLASSCGNESVAYFLLQQGAEIEASDNRGWTALFHATFSGHQNMVKFLLDNEANMDAVDSVREMTPFMEAAAAGHEIIVQYFLQHGVNVNMKCSSGDTARSLALMKGNRKIVSLIDNYNMGAFPPIRILDQDSSNPFENLSSSDEAFPVGMRRTASRRSRPTKAKGVSIQDGPEAVEVLMDRANAGGTCAKKRNLTIKRPVNGPIIPQGYVAFADSLNDDDLDVDAKFRYRDVTSPINLEDHLDSSGGRDSADHDDECNVFSQTGALTVRSSSSSSSGLAAALKICRDLNSSDGSHSNGNHCQTPNAREVIMGPNLPCSNGKIETKNSTPCQWSGPSLMVQGLDGTDSNMPIMTCIGVDRDALVTLHPQFLSKQAYLEQCQMLQKRPQNLAELLQDLNLMKYLPIFEEQDVDLQVFLTLTDNDLHEIGIKLFGPRKKMNVAIARWHSNARPSGNDLEQAYADRLETEMQEMAIQLHQANNLAEQMRHQLLLEQQLRSVTEACLMEDRATSQHICQPSVDNLKRCHTLQERLTDACSYMDELSRRVNEECQSTQHCPGSQNTGHSDPGTTTRHSVSDAGTLSSQQLLSKLKNCHEDLSRMSAAILMNTETILKKQFKTVPPGFPTGTSTRSEFDSLAPF